MARQIALWSFLIPVPMGFFYFAGGAILAQEGIIHLPYHQYGLYFSLAGMGAAGSLGLISLAQSFANKSNKDFNAHKYAFHQAHSKYFTDQLGDLLKQKQTGSRKFILIGYWRNALQPGGVFLYFVDTEQLPMSFVDFRKELEIVRFDSHINYVARLEMDVSPVSGGFEIKTLAIDVESKTLETLSIQSLSERDALEILGGITMQEGVTISPHAKITIHSDKWSGRSISFVPANKKIGDPKAAD
jgi:hypothetical protein